MVVNKYLKAVLAAALPILAAINAWIVTGQVNGPELWLGATGLVAAALVAAFPNQATGIQQMTKAIVAALTPLASFLIQYFLSGADFDKAQFSTLVIGGLTAIIVYLANNGNPSVTAPPHTGQRRP